MERHIKCPFARVYPDAMTGVESFYIASIDRWCGLYMMTGRTPSTKYSLYWDDSGDVIQHAMGHHEVFTVLSDLLDPENAELYRKQ